MPALRLFGRRWMLSGDDVPILAFGPTIFHGAWCIALFVSWLVLDRPASCHGGAKYVVALAGLGFSFLANFVLGVCLIHEGLKGSIFESKKRHRVEPLLMADILVYAIEFCFVVYGTVVLYMTPPLCLRENHEVWSPNGVMNVMIWTTWAILAISLILLLLTYNFFPDFQDERSWERRCRLVTMLCCCKFRNVEPHGDTQSAPYARLAALFSQIFGVIDLVPSDVLASFLLTAAMQRANRSAALKHLMRSMPTGPDPGGRLASKESHSSATGLESEASARSTDPILPQRDSHASSELDVAGPSTLFTPSGMAAQMLGHADPGEVSQRHARRWEMSPVSDHDIDEAAHYSRFAFGAYGYLLYIWSQPQYKGVCGLCCGRGFGLWTGPLRRYYEAFTASNFMPELAITNAMNREAMQQMTGLDDRDIVFVRYVNEAKDKHCLPYFIAVDRSTKSVVLAIRGTLSFEDCLTDFMCEPAALNEWISGAAGGVSPASFDEDAPAVQLASRDSTVTAHAGILAAAKAVVDDLQSTGELVGLLENKVPQRRHARRQGREGQPHPTHDCRFWRVVVTGHSLGAGVSVLVALYLRNFFRNVFCWAFAPPGGLAEPSVAEAARSFCTSVAIGKDWIPRLTVASFEHLRDEMIMAAARCKISKTAFLLGLLRGKKWEPDKLFSEPHEASLPLETRQLIGVYRTSAKRSSGARERYQMARTFIMPGRLMYLRPLKTKPKVKKARRKYDAVWANAEDLHGEGIIVSPRMMADHMPDYVTKILCKLARTRRRENPDFAAAAGPAAGSGLQTAAGPPRSRMAIDVDSESGEGEEFVDDDELNDDDDSSSADHPRPPTSRSGVTAS